jgi:hypothetical protein
MTKGKVVADNGRSRVGWPITNSPPEFERESAENNANMERKER